MNELQQMKMQIEQLMNMMKQKDQIIADQNMKLNSFSNGQKQNILPNFQLPINQFNPFQNMMQPGILPNTQPMSIQQLQTNGQQPQPVLPNMQMTDGNSFLGYPQQNFNQYVPNGYGNIPIPNMH